MMNDARPRPSPRSKRRRIVLIGGVGSIVLLAGVIALVLLVGDRDGVRISVENDTEPPAPLDAVELSVRGDAIRIGNLRHGERQVVRLHPKGGESSVTLGFVLGGRTHDVTTGYVEASGGYRAEWVVRESGAVFMRECLGAGVSCDTPLYRVHDALPTEPPP